MEINIAGGSYQNKYVAVNPSRTINWYIHKPTLQGEEDKNPKGSLHPFPGLPNYANTGATTAIRGIYNAKTLTHDRCFIVADQTLWEIDSAGALTNRGTMSDMSVATTKAYMAVNSANQLMIAAYDAGYIFNLGTNVLAKITDADYPSNVTYLDYTQGYFIICSGGRVYYSDLLDGTAWTAASVFTPSAQADNTIAAVVWRDQVFCFGSNTIETYNITSAPFEKAGSDTVFHGAVSADTIQVFDKGIVFVGQAPKEQANVYYYNGQTLSQLSPSSLIWQINNSASAGNVLWENVNINWENWDLIWGADLSFMYSELIYSKDGHIFYYLTVPSLYTTYVFDFLTQEWVERQSISEATGSQIQFRGKHCTTFKGENLWGDSQTGYILKEDYTSGIEGTSSVITRTRISSVLSNERKFIGVSSFELDGTTGKGLRTDSSTNANIAFYYSRDGGNTWSAAQNLATGTTGIYQKQPKTHHLGTARDWAFKIVQTDNSDLAINSATVHGSIGSF